MVANFIPLLAPTNRMTYDSPQFYNEAIAIVAGVCAGVLAFRLLPPLSPAVRTTRLLALTLRDLRHLTARTVATTASEWEGAIYTRLSALPEQADPLQRAQLLAAISVGTQIIRLRGIARRFDLMPDLAPALTAVAAGDSRGAVERLTGFDRLLAALPAGRPGLPVRLRARGLILATAEALTQHAAYFDAGVRP
ncbi:MAG: FUSC family protein [Rhodospirillales bacterium]